MTRLVLGPLLRHVDEHCATVWLETDGPATVRLDAGAAGSVEAATFAVHGHHYALLCLADLEPGARHPYRVSIDGDEVWPEPDSRLPAPVLATLDHAEPLRLAFGSCRTSVAHDAGGNDLHGVDALRAYALLLAGVTGGGSDDVEPAWPHLVLFLGDQVYADETTDAMREFISSRRDIDQPPGHELKDYEEYAHLYQLAWSDPANRWLLSTVPSLMIFDDHDIRDDWNTSRAWKDEMEATAWWHGRIVAGLASYWVHQHLGNLSPAEREADEIWREVVAHRDEPGWDAGPLLDAFAERVDQEPRTYRWSYARDFGDQARLVVVDSRAARVLDPETRSLLDPDELDWLRAQLCGDVDHLLVGTSLPFLLAPGLHHVEAFSEGLAAGGWGRRGRRLGEWARQTVDLEHWAAFQSSFQAVAAMVLEVARGERGRAPGTITFLSGDVHHSYLSEARARRGDTSEPLQSRVLQAVCSPIRNPLSRKWRFATAVLSYGVAGPLGHLLAGSAKVPEPPLRWGLLRGPWFDNNLATLEVRGRGLRLWWATGRVENGEDDRPRLARVADVELR